MTAIQPVLTKEPVTFFARPAVKKILVAIAIIMAVGLAVTAFMHVPWFVPLAFFGMGLVALFPLRPITSFSISSLN
ncbi:MAG TPA: hypothetical protein VLF94_06985 [Chlamydiales bacterium]|nr:hypothetical protein [Chlamydiales bacterium]